MCGVADLKNRILLCVILLTVFCVTPVFSQKQQKNAPKKNSTKVKKISRPNFSGTWELDVEKSTKSEIGRAILAKIKNLTSLLIVEQTALSIKFTEKELIEFIDSSNQPPQSKELTRVYFTDGRGETNNIGLEEKTSTKWIGQKLVITNYSYGQFARKVEPVSVFEITISEDENTLFRRFKLVASNKKEEEEFAEFESLIVYNRKKE